MRALYLKKLSLTAVFTALVAVATIVIVIPMPGVSGGYINFGDTIIFVGASLLGPLGGFFSGAVGSSIADLIYAPKWILITFIVKGLEGLLCGLISARFKKTKVKSGISLLVAMVPAATLMAVGYFFGGWMLEGLSSGSFMTGFTVAIADIPFNLIQAGVSVGVGYIIAFALSKVKYISDFLSIKKQYGGINQPEKGQNTQKDISDVDIKR